MSRITPWFETAPIVRRKEINFCYFFVVFSRIEWIVAHCLLARQYVVFLEVNMGSDDDSELKLSEKKSDASEDLRIIKTGTANNT